MIDEEKPLADTVHESEADGYLYDFFKFQTQLSLLTLAGVFGVSQINGAMNKVGELPFFFIMATVAIGGITSFMGASEMVRAKNARLPLGPKVEFLRRLASGAYAVGVGGFLLLFVLVAA